MIARQLRLAVHYQTFHPLSRPRVDWISTLLGAMDDCRMDMPQCMNWRAEVSLDEGDQTLHASGRSKRGEEKKKKKNFFK